MSGPLEAIKVLDFSAMIAGPYCTRMLADLGAEVVKVEPVQGDFMRSSEPQRAAADGSGHSAYYAALNAGKHSIAIDLKAPEGKQLAADLAAKADVVVENFRPGVMKRLGLDYDSLARENPKLVYCSISGYGQTGAAADRPGYAPIMHAACGFELATLAYQEGIERPLKSGIFVADVLSGSLAFGAVNAALVSRERSGQGDYIDVSLMDCMLGLMLYECQEAQFPERFPRVLYQPVRARDGFLIVAPISQANFEAMARAASHPEWIADPRFNGPARRRNWVSLMGLLEAWAGEHSVAECENAMLDGGVPCSRYQTVAEAMASDAVKSRGTFATVRDGAGELLAPNPPFTLRNARAKVGEFVDSLDSSRERVVRDWLGKTA